MKKAILVPINKAEQVRLELQEHNLLDKVRKIQIRIDKNTNEKFLEIPVHDSFDNFLNSLPPLEVKSFLTPKELESPKELEISLTPKELKSYPLIDQSKPQYYIDYKKSYSLKNILKNQLTEYELIFVPTGWQIIGNIIIITIPFQIQNKATLIAKTIFDLHPFCKSVLQDFGIKGNFRKPYRKILIGFETETIHKEQGCYFKLDVTKIMYSKGNLNERKRMSLLGSDEIIIDMFAGIGYFSIPMAVHSMPKKIISIELNPIAYNYLVKNIALNRVENIITAINEDCMNFMPHYIADRVIMGYMDDSHKYLEKGMLLIKKSGGIIHYHIIDRGEYGNKNFLSIDTFLKIEKIASKLNRKFEIKSIRRIKKYSPKLWHVVLDIFIK